MSETQAGGGRRLLNATAVMASGTAVSRVLGLVRAMLIAFVLTFRKKPTPRWLLWLVLTCAAVNFVIMVAALGFPAI